MISEHGMTVSPGIPNARKEEAVNGQEQAQEIGSRSCSQIPSPQPWSPRALEMMGMGVGSAPPIDVMPGVALICAAAHCSTMAKVSPPVVAS